LLIFTSLIFSEYCQNSAFWEKFWVIWLLVSGGT